MMDFLRLGDLRQERSRARIADAILAAHEDEGGESEADDLGIHACFVAIDDVPLLQLANPVEDRRRRHPEAPRDLGVGHSCIALQEGDDLAIGVVERSARGSDGHVEGV